VEVNRSRGEHKRRLAENTQRRQPSLMETFKRSRVICVSDVEDEHDSDCLAPTPATASASVVPVPVCEQ
jgi:hypothetical protein